ncbi:thioesterase II family protein [Actinoplanes sp. NPDC020271]|uniref:thioesterase II family protein n=1 Tax=Actinoplanes sp. NPDC020271 TaxID=3363896 RepID=UPI00379A20CC
MNPPNKRNTWVRQFNPAHEAPVRVVCFPHAGGAASYFHPLSRALFPHADVLAIQYPGRQDRFGEPCIEDIFLIAERISDELLTWSDRPLVLFGHSMGAAVAFETALRLESHEVTPLILFASGRNAPSVRRRQRVDLATDAELIAEVKRLNGANAAFLSDEALLEVVMPSIRSDHRAVARYHNSTARPLRCPIVAMLGDVDPIVDIAEAQRWSHHTLSSFRMRVFSGGHFFLEQHADAVLDEIRASIRCADGL